MEDELVQLAEVYRSPGFLLLATDDDGQRLGCVGLRSLEPSNGITHGEIRRLFVRGTARRTGLGRALVERLLVDAQTAGFDRIVLNTLPAMTEAVALYESFGFTPCDPYVDEPLDDTLYMALSLNPCRR